MIQTGKNRSIGRKTCVSDIFSTINRILTGLESNPDLVGERLATDYLSYFIDRGGGVMNL
jgi:hypothetical protein